MASSYLMGTLDGEMPSPLHTAPRGPVIAVSSNKGGVGKTTLSSNLAIYLRALREDLPVLMVSLDDQPTVDRMFGLKARGPFDPNLKHGWAERSLERVIELGEYGVHFVPSPPDLASLKARAEDPRTLSRILARTAWDGVVLLDTKSDLEALTRNAWAAADRVIVPVADWASLEEARKILDQTARLHPGDSRVRLVFTLVDRRTRLVGTEAPLLRRLVDAAHERGWPYYKTYLSRSPRVEALNSGGARPLSILHHGRGTAVHSQLRELALEVLQDLEDEAAGAAARPEAEEIWAGRAPRSAQGGVARGLASGLAASAATLTSAWRRAGSLSSEEQ
jgi:cellulose biosynthesis protein BcsQ